MKIKEKHGECIKIKSNLTLNAKERYQNMTC